MVSTQVEDSAAEDAPVEWDDAMSNEKPFSVCMDNQIIWKTRTMNPQLVWLLNKHGLSYRILGSMMGINGQAARKISKRGAKQIQKWHEWDLRRKFVSRQEDIR